MASTLCWPPETSRWLASGSRANLTSSATSWAPSLVQTQAGTFDLAEAYLEYSLENAEVCIRQMTLAAVVDFDAAAGRLAFGEPFGDVARDISIDPFVNREEGVGAGGELGCSAPNALPEGLGVSNVERPHRRSDRTDSKQRRAPPGGRVPTVSRAVGSGNRCRSGTCHPLQGPDLFRQWAVRVLLDIDVDVNKRLRAWGVLARDRPVTNRCSPKSDSTPSFPA